MMKPLIVPSSLYRPTARIIDGRYEGERASSPARK
jgi:hypothetical protein